MSIDLIAQAADDEMAAVLAEDKELWVEIGREECELELRQARDHGQALADAVKEYLDANNGAAFPHPTSRARLSLALREWNQNAKDEDEV